VVLPTAVASPSPFFSVTAAFILAELLLVLVMDRLGDGAHTRLAIWDDGRAHELSGHRPAPAGQFRRQ
jgi:hypothetical protein